VLVTFHSFSNIQPSRSLFSFIMIYSPVALSLISLLYTTTAVHASVVFTVNCDPLTVQRSDPIVSPGVASGHVHAISGGTAFNRTMLGNDSAVNAKATTCDKFTDHSNYVCVSELFKEENNNILQWCPQLYHQSNNMFEIVPYTGVVSLSCRWYHNRLTYNIWQNIYYKNYTCSYKEEGNWCDNPTDARAFPPGLRMVAGSSTRRFVAHWNIKVLLLNLLELLTFQIRTIKLSYSKLAMMEKSTHYLPLYQPAFYHSMSAFHPAGMGSTSIALIIRVM